MNNIDPHLSINHNKVIWCVYGPYGFPTMFCCVIKTASHIPAIWGYSEYRRSPGFRTLGREITGGWIEEHDAKFFNTQADALAYMGELTTPRCDVHGNKIKQPSKKQQATALLKRLGVNNRTTIYGAERELILERIKDLAPIDSGSSLHWWSEDYVVDGVKYQIGASHGSAVIELVDRVEEPC
jgi:hypothetical protein